jgi:hypothetical protein
MPRLTFNSQGGSNATSACLKISRMEGSDRAMRRRSEMQG